MLIAKGQDDFVKPEHTESLPLYQVFGIGEPWVLDEELYVSDSNRDDHYTFGHSKNKGFV